MSPESLIYVGWVVGRKYLKQRGAKRPNSLTVIHPDVSLPNIGRPESPGCREAGWGSSRTSCPELVAAGVGHGSATARTGVAVPFGYAGTAAPEAEAAHFAAERWCRVAYHASHHERLQRVAVGASHRCDVLAHESAALIDVGLIAAGGTPVYLFSRHVAVCQ